MVSETEVNEADLLQVGEDLLASSGVDKALYYDENGNLTTQKFNKTVLTGDEAMMYLLGKTRRNQQLMRGDHALITKRFRPLSESHEKDDLFWKNIRLRVWNVKNVGEKTIDITVKKSDDTYDKHVGGEYIGDIFDGRALEGFVPNVPNSPKHQEFRVQLLSVEVSEAMYNANPPTKIGRA